VFRLKFNPAHLPGRKALQTSILSHFSAIEPDCAGVPSFRRIKSSEDICACSKSFYIDIDYAANGRPQTGSRMGSGYIESEASIVILCAV
jgi:hypothetical protein